MTQARFSCAVAGTSMQPFMLDTVVCNEFLKQVDGDTVLHLKCIGDPDTGKASVLQLWHECGGIERFELQCCMPQIPYNPPQIHSIKSSYIVNASVSVLRRLQKLCKTLRASKFTFVIQNAGKGDEKKNSQNMVVTFEFVSSDGRSKVARVFRQGLDDDTEPGETVHTSSVALRTLVSFIRNMDRDASITIGLANDLPVVLNYDLGTPGSYIRCIAATV